MLLRNIQPHVFFFRNQEKLNKVKVKVLKSILPPCAQIDFKFYIYQATLCQQTAVILNICPELCRKFCCRLP